MDGIRLPDGWAEWKVKEEIGSGSYGTVYKASREIAGSTMYSAIKVVTIPPKGKEAEAAFYGIGSLDTEGSRNMADTYLREVRAMAGLRGESNIVSIEDFHVREEDDGIHQTIFIRMEYLESLEGHMLTNPLSQEDVVKLGMDICTALERCEELHIVHRDIKPANIMVSKSGNYKLGDFGTAKQFGTSTMSGTVSGTFDYIAPELLQGKPVTEQADIYSLGIVLYKLLNNNREPFLDPEKQIILPDERMEALNRRISGEPFPEPASGTPVLKSVVLMACNPDPRRRFRTATAFKTALASSLPGQTKSTGKHMQKAATPQTGRMTGSGQGAGIMKKSHTEVLRKTGKQAETTLRDIGNAPLKTTQAVGLAGSGTTQGNVQASAGTSHRTGTHVTGNRQGKGSPTAQNMGTKKPKMPLQVIIAVIAAAAAITCIILATGRMPVKKVPAANSGAARTDIDTSSAEATASGPAEEQSSAIVDLSWADALPYEAGQAFSYTKLTTGIQIDSYNGTGTTFAIPGEIGGDLVTAIADGAFQDNRSLKDISLPDTVTTIGSDAFNGCLALTHVKLPASLKYIGKNAFTGTAITEIYIPGTILNTGDYNMESTHDWTGTQNAFYGCISLSTVEVGKGSTFIPPGFLYNVQSVDKVYLPEGVEEIGSHAFRYATSLNDINLPDSLFNINEGAFYNCLSLSSIDLPPYVTYLGSQAFSYTPVTRITIPKTLLSVGDYNSDDYSECYSDQHAFFGCESLKTVEVEEGMRRLPPFFMWYIRSLENVILPSTLMEISDYAFTTCQGLTSLTLPDRVTKIGDYAFYNCKGIEELALPNGLRQVGECAFTLSGLKSVTIPPKLESVGKYLEIEGEDSYYDVNPFYDCPSLAYISVAEGMKELPSYFMFYVEGVREVSLPSTIKSIGSYAFYETDVEVIHYASNAKDWENIQIGAWNTALGNITIEYET